MRSGFLRLEESLFGLIEGFDFESEVLEVLEVGALGFGLCLEVEDLVDESAEVTKRTHGTEGRIVQIAIQSADGAENKSVFDDVDTYAAVIEFGRQ